MNLEEWAEQFLQASAPADIVDLHVRDVIAAFFAGRRTSDGEALARFFGKGNRAQLAAAVASIARLSECDDIHLASCVTPGAVVIPVALAFAEGHSADSFNRAVAAGYAAGMSLGVAIGGAQALAQGIWPTLLAAPLMAAVTASCLAGHDVNHTAHAMALALAGTSGRIGRPAGTPSGRWYLFADGVLRGISASEAAGAGFQGDLSTVAQLRQAPSLSEVGFKPFPIARQAANAVLAFQSMLTASLDLAHIDSIEVFVPPMNVALLNRPLAVEDRLSRLSHMGFQLACAALAPEMLYDPARETGSPAPFAEFARRVLVIADPDLDAHLPDRWAARVVVKSGGVSREETVIATSFDHDSPTLSAELAAKWRRLLSEDEGRELLAKGGLPPDPGSHAILWEGLERRVSMAAKRPSA